MSLSFSTIEGFVSFKLMSFLDAFQVRPRKTPPLTLFIVFIILSSQLFAVGLLIMTLAPSYSTFGSQTFCNGPLVNGIRSCLNNPNSIIICGLDSPSDICTVNVHARNMHRLMYNFSSVSSFLFYGQWLFLASAVIYPLWTVSKKVTKFLEVVHSLH